MDGCIPVRDETALDLDAVRTINRAAFGRAGEADLVDALRRQARPCLSLVAELDAAVIGHIMFSPVTLDPPENAPADARLMGIGPMAVLPPHQRRGVGSALVRTGLDRCRALGVAAVVVLGHPAFYPRFGFAPASRAGIGCEYDAPDEAFMLLALRPGALRGTRGVARYHAAFAAL
jgi:putative acetyltransferase